MGYDIYWADLKVTDDEGTPDGAYFHANVHGWGKLCDEMSAQGLIHPTPMPAHYPQWAEFGVHVSSSGEPDETSEAYRAWEAAYEGMLRAGDENPVGLPSHKLLLNEGFVLLPAEIDAALACASETPVTLPDDEAFRDFWRSWLDYLCRAVTQGGGARVT